MLSVSFIKYYQLQLLGQSGTNVGESIKQTSPDFSQKTYMSKAWDWDVADTFAVLSLKRVLNHDFHWTNARKFYRETDRHSRATKPIRKGSPRETKMFSRAPELHPFDEHHDAIRDMLNHDFHWTNAHKFYREKQIVTQGPLTKVERVTERN